MIRFIDRLDEIEVLERDWNRQKNAFIVVFGRRRIGKTCLINQFIRNKDGIRYTAEDISTKIQIREFQQSIASFLKDDFLAKQEIQDWSSLFEYLSKVLDKQKRIYVWIDEFSYIIKNDHSITSVLQKFIDGFLRNSNIFLIVSGSLYGLMSERVLSHSSPLFGRRTRDLLLKPIPPAYIKEFLPFNFEDSLKTALTVNGIPEYLRVASQYKDYNEFINTEFLKYEGYFYREPFFLLSQEFKEIRIYFSILNAIAYGNSKPTEIANFVGLNAREIYPYLELLISYGFIAREVSIIGDNKRGIYYISDNFFDFWFNFVYKNREMLEKGHYKLEEPEIKSYLGKRFEIFVRQNFMNIFDNFDNSGRWWHKDQEIDVVGINEKTKEIMFGECKWQENVNSLEVLRDLNAKTIYVNWYINERKESFVIFAKSFKKKITEFENKPVMCFDLKDLEKLLKKD